MFFKRNSIKRLLQAADKGDVEAQFTLGVMYQEGDGVKQDYLEALTWFTKAADQNFPLACSKLGLFYNNGWGVSQDYAECIKWWRRAAELGLEIAQANLGMMYYQGQGVAQNYVEAAKWYRAAAEQGVPIAQFNLANLYREGKGVPRDCAEAIKLYSQVAEQGDLDSQTMLAVMYMDGEGVELHYELALKEAVRWLTQAAERGDPRAQNFLGTIFSEGRPEDPNAVGEWLDKSSNVMKSDADGSARRIEGYVVKPDADVARKWFRLASEQGYLEAQHNLELLENSEESIPGETMGNLLLQRDTLQHISFVKGDNDQRAGREIKNPTIRVVDTKVLEPPTDPAEGWVEQWTVSFDGEQADYRVEYKSDGSGGYLISTSVLK